MAHFGVFHSFPLEVIGGLEIYNFFQNFLLPCWRLSLQSLQTLQTGFLPRSPSPCSCQRTSAISRYSGHPQPAGHGEDQKAFVSVCAFLKFCGFWVLNFSWQSCIRNVLDTWAWCCSCYNYIWSFKLMIDLLGLFNNWKRSESHVICSKVVMEQEGKIWQNLFEDKKLDKKKLFYVYALLTSDCSVNW